MKDLYQIIEYRPRPEKETAKNGSSEMGSAPQQWQRIGTGSLVAFTKEAAQRQADELAKERLASNTPSRFEVRPFVRLPGQEDSTEEDLS